MPSKTTKSKNTDKNSKKETVIEAPNQTVTDDKVGGAPDVEVSLPVVNETNLDNQKPTVEVVEGISVETSISTTESKTGDAKPKRAPSKKKVNEDVQTGGKPKAKAKGKGKGKTVDADAKPKTVKKKSEKSKVSDDEITEAPDGSDGSEKKIRSFKVKLPNKEEFEGRFTGLTPYQAANKALSKYFRENDNPQAEITFSICESTRKSKKTTYTYIGRRQKLDVPVTYKIQDGRVIEKNFKNSLKKVKKADVVQ